jgi:PilZ domain
MTEVRDRRAVPRTTLAERPAARVRGMRQVHLLDLSRTGARIEHLDLLRLGAPCDLDFSLPVGALNLPVQVVWCTVIGRARRPGGDSRLVARSGLRFATLTVAQDAARAWILSAQQ